MNTKQTLAFFKARQRKGDITLVSDNTGYSLSHVSNTLAGRRNNVDIVNEFYKVSRRRKAVA